MKDFTIFCTAFFISALVTPLVQRFALKFNFIAKPREDRWHKTPTAILGGVTIYLSYLSVCLLFLIHIKNIVVILMGSTAFFIIGLLDDIRSLSAPLKLFCQIIISCLVVYFGVSIPLAHIGIPLTVLWIIGITNAFNLLDNMDGLSCGIAVIVSLMVYFSSLFSNNNPLGIIALVLAGSALGFLPYNFNPAKIFMGDCGSMFIGFTLAALTISDTPRQTSNVIVVLLIPVMIMAIPIFDTTLVTILRSFRGRSIMKGGRDHVSHRLVSLGLSERRTVLLLYMMSILFGLIALSYSRWDFIITSVIVGLTVVVLILFGIFLSDIKTYDEKEYDAQRNKKIQEGKAIINTFILHKRRVVELLADFMLICIAYYGAHLLRFEGVISDANAKLIRNSLPLIIFFRLNFFWYFGLYKGMWRYIGISDLAAIVKAVSLSSVFTIISLTFLFRFDQYSRVIFIIDWLLCIFLISSIRIMIRFLNEYFSSLAKGRRNVLIFGAGDMGELILRELKRNKNLNYNPVGFIDDDLSKSGKRIHGVSILGTRSDIPSLIKYQNIDEILIAVSSDNLIEPEKLIALLKEFNISYRTLSGILTSK